MRTNCNNCGAPLVNGKCEYCGTEWFKPGINFGNGYILEAKVSAHNIYHDAGRDMNGILRSTKVDTLYTLQLEIVNLKGQELKSLLDAIGMERLNMMMGD